MEGKVTNREDRSKIQREMRGKGGERKVEKKRKRRKS